MRISVSEWTTLRLALKLPRAILNPELLAPALRRHGSTRRGQAVVGAVLLAVLVFLHVKTADPAVTRLTDISAQLAGAKLIDAGWDTAAIQARGDAAPRRRPTVESADLPRIQRALDAAAAEAKTTALRTSIADLKKAYVEKADVAARFETASADSRQALAATRRADAAITGLIRSAWADFPQRDRLIAAENLAVRVIAEAQQYHYAPTPAHRASLEAYTLDLPRAKELPKTIQAALSRLETDVHQILLLKPLEHMLGERLAALKTGPRIEELSTFYQTELADTLARRERYRIALIAYTIALLALLAYLGVRAITRYRDLEMLYAGQTRELAKALHRLRGGEGPAQVTEIRRAEPPPPDEDARIISEITAPRSARQPGGTP
ncbi:MAG TPA: DAHL domain-containing protein [Burkholderiales bacterium]|nr:DAHL domain-containing protein [Burkholderiales bacterium]